jgi:hypothetical protein
MGMRAVVLALALSTHSPSGPAAAPLSGQDGLIRDPPLAARTVYDAWQATNRQVASAIATEAAVIKLFKMAPERLTFTRCQRTGDGEFECIYRNAKTDFEVWFKVLGGASAGYHVESVSFSTN